MRSPESFMCSSVPNRYTVWTADLIGICGRVKQISGELLGAPPKGSVDVRHFPPCIGAGQSDMGGLMEASTLRRPALLPVDFVQPCLPSVRAPLGLLKRLWRHPTLGNEPSAVPS
jgi:hypothetical protein